MYHQLVKKVSMLRQSGNTIKTLLILRTNMMKSSGSIKLACNRLLNASTAATSVGVVSGVSTIGMASIVVNLPIGGLHMTSSRT